MIIKKIVVVVVFFAALTFLGDSFSVRAEQLSSNDQSNVKSALKATENRKWKLSRRYISRIQDPLARKLAHWFSLTKEGSGATFHEITSFVASNPDWPMQVLLRRRAEELMAHNILRGDIVDWFKKYPPVSAVGQARLGGALLGLSEIEQGQAILRDAWINGNFTKNDEKNFYKRYRKILTNKDHVLRMDRLLWEGRKWPARRMMWKVGKDIRILSEARYLLRHMQGNVDKAIAKVPAELKNDPGLAFERIRWRRRKGRDESARELFLSLPDTTSHLEKWWAERNYLARLALRKGKAAEAYSIVKDHGLKEGPEFAQAEWMTGWIALRFLNKPQSAMNHFVTMYNSVKYPISRARGAFWAGRAAEALNDVKTAEQWFRLAISAPTTYHGQLAAVRLNQGPNMITKHEPKFKVSEVIAFDDHELVRLARMLSALDKQNLMKSFVLSLGRFNDTPSWRAMTASLAHSHDRPDLAIRVSKLAARDGYELLDAGYPALTPPHINGTSAGPDKVGLETPLVLAVIRQESAFYVKAKSPAGALGLMQIMPGTARKVARQLKIKYSRNRLSTDADYNLTLGQTYLADLLDKFNGSYVLALAAYNAGPARAIRWLRDNGDPRTSTVDAIDWIEMIPFNETRNYVQRVLENLQVYRLRLAESSIALNIESDLKR